MLFVLTAWLIIFLLLVTCGCALVHAYESVTKHYESHNLIDLFIIGLCALSGILGLISFMFPCNQVILGILLILSFLYWSLVKEQRTRLIEKIKSYYKNTSKFQILLVVLSVLIFLLYATWTMMRHDSTMYHFQQIRWNEEYSIIPGLANLEVRFGVNSSYFLTASIFTFRFLLGEAIYPLHSLLALMILVWIIGRFYTSRNYKILLLLFIYVLFIYVNAFEIRGLSNDIVPNLIVFYLFARLIIEPSLLKKNFMLFIFVPFLLVTFKLSAALFFLIGIYPLCFIIKRRQWKIFRFLFISVALLLLVWGVRNVIITGYLIYPLYVIDLFTFDWKVPSIFLEKESEYIKSFANSVFYKLFTDSDKVEPMRYYVLQYIYWGVYVVISILSILVCTLSFCRKIKLQNAKVLYFACGVLLINILFWFISAPDPRFISGCFFITVFLGLYISLPDRITSLGQKYLPYLAIVPVLFLLIDASKWVKTHSQDTTQLTNSMCLPQFDSGQYYLNRPIYTAKELNDNVVIYLTDDPQGRCFDLIPCVKEKDDSEANYQDYKNLEPRGQRINDGFRYRMAE